MTTDPKHLTESEASAEAARLIAEAYRPTPVVPTSYRDDSPVPAYGSTPPVPQPDSRIVPSWAVGVAVASIGVGAGVTGLGCGAWLILQGLASVTLTGVLAVTLPFAGIAAAATAIGSAFARVRRTSTTNVYQGTVVQRTEVTATARGRPSRSHQPLGGFWTFWTPLARTRTRVDLRNQRNIRSIHPRSPQFAGGGRNGSAPQTYGGRGCPLRDRPSRP